MPVSVRLFARLRDVTGDATLERSIEAASTVADVWNQLCIDYPTLEPYGASLSAAVNEDYARMETPVKDGDEIAFLPPVSGGSQRATPATPPRRRRRF
jgi:molybdopterin converting factor subunit 1